MADPQLTHRRAFVEVPRCCGGFRVLNPLPILGRSAGVQPYAAALGEHSAGVLGEAGYTDREIDELRTTARWAELDVPLAWTGPRFLAARCEPFWATIRVKGVRSGPGLPLSRCP